MHRIVGSCVFRPPKSSTHKEYIGPTYELTTREPGAVYFNIGTYAVQNVPLYLALGDGMLYFPLLDSQPDFFKI